MWTVHSFQSFYNIHFLTHSVEWQALKEEVAGVSAEWVVSFVSVLGEGVAMERLIVVRMPKNMARAPGCYYITNVLLK